MKPTFVEKYESIELSFIPKTGAYNYHKTVEGFELNFALETEDPEENTKEKKHVSYGPSIQVKIYSKYDFEEEIKVGFKKEHQPAYIDEHEEPWKSNYYCGHHQGLENFTIEILDKKENTLVCKVIGTINDTLIKTDNSPIPVTIIAEFKKDPKLKNEIK